MLLTTHGLLFRSGSGAQPFLICQLKYLGAPARTPHLCELVTWFIRYSWYAQDRFVSTWPGDMSSLSSRVSSCGVMRVRPHAPQVLSWVCFILARLRKCCRRVSPTWFHSALAASLSDCVIISQALLRSHDVSQRFWSCAISSRAASMVALTALAE